MKIAIAFRANHITNETPHNPVMSSSSSVRITVAVIVIFGFGLATVYASFEGDVCQIHRTETEGICRPLQKCPRTYAEIAKRQTPTFCRKGKSPIVCCPHEPKPKIQTPSVGIRNVSNRRISETSMYRKLWVFIIWKHQVYYKSIDGFIYRMHGISDGRL